MSLPDLPCGDRVEDPAVESADTSVRSGGYGVFSVGLRVKGRPDPRAESCWRGVSCCSSSHVACVCAGSAAAGEETTVSDHTADHSGHDQQFHTEIAAGLRRIEAQRGKIGVELLCDFQICQ